VTRRRRTLVFLPALALLAAMLGWGMSGLPGFGDRDSAYAREAIKIALQQRHTGNTVNAVTFDIRGFDTLGEEFILFAAVVATVALLRQTRDEQEDREELEDAMRQHRPATGSTLLVSYVLMPITTLLGLYVIAHGHVSPGGGFQGGVVLATSVHLLYVGGGYGYMNRARPVSVHELGEALAAGGFVVVGVAGLVQSSTFLVNLMPPGALRSLLSSGNVGLLNGIVGLEVATAAIVIVAKFLEQYVQVRARRSLS
jgi:multicomponent Na+:H+ antiporter subunit B